MSEGGGGAFGAGSIFATLGLDVSPFAQGMLQAQSIGRLFPSFVGEFLANPLLGIAGILKDLTHELREFFESSIEGGVRLARMARNVGASAEALSGLSKAAKASGLGLDDIGEAMKFLGRNASEAADGDRELLNTFRRLGIQVRDSSGHLRSVKDLFFDLADAMRALPEGGMRSSMSLKLMGKSSFEMVGFLSQGSRAIQEQIERFKSLGVVSSEESAKTAMAWYEAEEIIDAGWAGLKASITRPVRVALLPSLEELSKWVEAHAPQIRATVEGIATGAATAFSRMKQRVGEAIQETVAHMEELKVAAAAAGAAMAVFAASSVITALPGILTAIGTAIAGVVAFLGAPVTIIAVLAAAVAGLLQHFGLLAPAWDKIKEGASAVAGVLSGAFKASITWIMGTAVPAIRNGLAGAWAAVEPAVTALMPLFKGVWDLLKGLAQFIGAIAVVSFQALAIALSWVGGLLADLFAWLGKVASFVGAVLGPVLAPLVWVLQKIGDLVLWLIGLFGKLLSLIGSTLSSAASDVRWASGVVSGNTAAGVAGSVGPPSSTDPARASVAGAGAGGATGVTLNQSVYGGADANATGRIAGEAAARAVREGNARRDNAAKAEADRRAHGAAL